MSPFSLRVSRRSAVSCSAGIRSSWPVSAAAWIGVKPFLLAFTRFSWVSSSGGIWSRWPEIAAAWKTVSPAFVATRSASRVRRARGHLVEMAVEGRRVEHGLPGEIPLGEVAAVMNSAGMRSRAPFSAASCSSVLPTSVRLRIDSCVTKPRRQLAQIPVGGRDMEDGVAGVAALGQGFGREQGRRHLVEVPADGRVMQGGVAGGIPERQGLRRQQLRRQVAKTPVPRGKVQGSVAGGIWRRQGRRGQCARRQLSQGTGAGGGVQVMSVHRESLLSL